MSDWIDVPAAEQPKANDGWVDVPATAAPSQPDLDVAKNVYPSVGPILSAFGHGAKEGWGDDPIGLSPESVKWLSDKKIFGPEKGGYDNPFQAFNELLAHTVVGAVDIAARGGAAALRGYQAGVAATGEQIGTPGLGRDLAAMPEAFFGSPHPMGVPKQFPPGTVFREVPEESRIAPNPSPQAPKFIEAYHGSPHDFDAFDVSKIGTGEGAQAYGHGLYFAEKRDLAEYYRKTLSGTKPSLKAYADPDLGPLLREADENMRSAESKLEDAFLSDDDQQIREAKQALHEVGLSQQDLARRAHREFPAGALYHVRINADVEHFLDWDKPIAEQSEHIQKALEGPGWGFPSMTGQELVKQFGDQGAVSEGLSALGIPGIKYLDAGSRGIGVGQDLASLEKNLAENREYLERLRNINGPEDPHGMVASQERVVANIEKDVAFAKNPTRNFVVFDHDNIEITHKNGEPVGPSDIVEPGSVPQPITEARELGVIGPDKPDVTKGTPAQAAEAQVPRVMAAARGGASESISGPEPGGGAPEKAGNIRLDQIGINHDAKDVILDAAKNNDDFNQARAGNVPLAQVESLSGASGVPSAVLTGNEGLGRLMHNDAVVRTWLQAFHQASDEIAAQLAKVRATGDEADIATLREMKLRFQHMQEQVSGLTAEAGRTLAVFREFYANKGKAEAIGKVLEDNPGNDVDSLKKLADAAGSLDPRTQLPRFLHDARQPTWWDKYLYYWVNALISGPVTHLKYIGANAAFGAYEAVAVTPVAGALGAARRLASGGTEGVYAGEAAARTWGLLAGTPDALKAAWTAARDNVMTPFPNEVAGTGVNPLTQVRPNPIGGKLGFAIGIPGRSAAGIHSFFRWLGYRAEIEAQAYRQAAKEGLSPVGSGPPPVADGSIRFYHGTSYKNATGFTGKTFVTTSEQYARDYHGGPNNVLYTDFTKDEAIARGLYDEVNNMPMSLGSIDDGAARLRPLAPEATGDSFWQRYRTIADQPTEAMVDAGIANGNHLTFIGEQGTFGKAVSRLANTRFGESGIQPFKLILPFTHIPGQILRAGLEQTPAAFLDEKMRGDILGKNGAVAADTARARLIAGGAVSAMVANWAVNDSLTGYGPTDPTERARWLRSHEPYSVRLGGWWYSYNKFGPIGDLVGLVSNLVEVGPAVKEGEYAEAAGRVLKATSHILEDEVGMQGLVNLIDAMNDPDRKMGRFVAGQAASNLPYSSLLRQTASVSDPYMREAKTFVDQLRYQVPWSRQDLLPKRDWLGQPMENPGYGSIIRQRAVNTDPIDMAVADLRGFKPAPPQDRIGGVKLPPKMYDEYQATAGAMARAALETVVNAPRWNEIPPGVREQVVHTMVENARKTAGSILQAKHPEIIMQGIQNRQDKITGAKPGKLTE